MTSTDTRSSGEGPRPGAPRPAAGVDAATTAVRAPGPADATTALPIQQQQKARAKSHVRRRPSPGVPLAGLPPVVHRWLSPMLALAAVAMLPVAAATTDLSVMDGWGLAKVLSPAAWAAMALAVAACVAELWSPRPRIPMLGAATTVLILCSFGLPSVVQPVARFTTAWLLAGFTDAIAGDGIPPTGVDARFYWPGFFAQWAWFRDAGGATQLDEVLRWFPPMVVGVWAIGIYALARSLLGGTRTPWVAAWLFLGLNWIEQDYFSPQATAIVLQLTVLTFALGPLATRRTDPAGVPGWPAPHAEAKKLPLLRRWLVAAMTPPNRPTLPPRQLLLIYFCAALCLLAIAPSHQLTPIALIGQLVVLAVVGRIRGRTLVLVGILAVGVYLIVAARPFWVNQLSMLLGSGEDGGAIENGVADRLMGDTGQVAVKMLRILVPGFTWLVAIAGAWVYWRRRRDLVPIALAVVPMGVIVQGYGGEVFMRVVLYGLPVLTILCADALRAAVRRWRWMHYVLAGGMVGLFALLVLIRGGNDAYQTVYPEDVALARQTIAETPHGQEIVPLSHVGPYGVEGIDTHSGGNVIDGCSQLANDPIRCIDADAPDVIITFTSVEREGVVLEGKEPGWSLRLIQELVASGRYVLAYQDGFNAVLKKAVPGPLAEVGG
ncbi:hypothetical protein [Pseudonocardia nigra]|uniref:hypothetical protein n=1 Tax=Pseudonocardia nigra TaxID=1921578 RepID=UPI001C6029F4|nr:hypothetical protein [Pseudonocardia nigra]